MKHPITYDISIALWRGNHAENEVIDLTIRSANAAWSDRWIAEIVERIWDMTNYSTLQIRTALRTITVKEVYIDYDQYKG